jgi:hypothetical protein
MTPDYVRYRLKKDGLGHYASEEKLVAWVAELLRDFVEMARAAAEWGGVRNPVLEAKPDLEQYMACRCPCNVCGSPHPHALPEARSM